MGRLRHGVGAKKFVLVTRTTAEMREALEAAALIGGRSLPQEVEFRLRASFAKGAMVTMTVHATEAAAFAAFMASNSAATSGGE